MLTAGSTGGHFLVRLVDVNESIIYAARLSRITAEVFPNVVNSCGNQLEVKLLSKCHVNVLQMPIRGSAVF